jgi:hypothetical protein
MNPRIGFLIGCVSIALTSPGASADAVGPRSELCNKLRKTVAEVTGKAFKPARSLDVKGHPLLCTYSPEEGWQGVNFELPDGDAKKLAEWRANFAKSPNKTMTGLTDLPELGPGAFRANEGGLVHVHGLAKKGLLIVRGGFKADVEVQLWKRIASEL